jgi:predicted  nucleic acid-binding Zn-ribbon protein
MELSSCPDCHDLAETLRHHVKMVDDARKYATDAHAGVVRHITPLEALQEQAEYYEDMMEDQDEAINDLEGRLEKQDTEIRQLNFILQGTEINYREARAQIELQLKYIRERNNKLEKFVNFIQSCECQDVAPGKCYWITQITEEAEELKNV